VRVVVADNGAGMAETAAGLVEDFLCSAPSPVLGLATGASVQPLYRELVHRHREGALSFSAAEAFLLDEYIGLDPDHPQLYRNVIHRELTGRIDIDPALVHSPDVHTADLADECVRYDRRVVRARIGLQILGIGRNGHLAFNEPGSPLDSRTRVVDLTPETREDNSRFFASLDEVPRRAMTQGLGTIMESERLLVIAAGCPKASAVRACLQGPVTPAIPASAIRLHPAATVLLDSDVAGLLTFRGEDGAAPPYRSSEGKESKPIEGALIAARPGRR